MGSVDMKCKKCGADLKETDKICLNCGTLVSSDVDELYDEINREDDEEQEDSEYENELDQLLNSYNTTTKEEKKKKEKEEDAPDYSEFDELNENKEEKVRKTTYNSKSNSDYEEDYSNPYDDELEVQDDYSYSDDDIIFDDNSGNNYDGKITNFSLKKIPFKLVLVLVGVVLLIIIIILIYKFVGGSRDKSAEYNSDSSKKDTTETSKYSLTDNPNYIKGKTWVCGDSLANGSLTNDRNSYFQYDFHTNGSYAMKYLEREGAAETGTYTVSLEQITDTTYVYKVSLVANLDSGYKTKYYVTFTTNADGNTSKYKFNSNNSVCEEKDYFNNKVMKGEH